jgi:hypothetical protein
MVQKVGSFLLYVVYFHFVGCGCLMSWERILSSKMGVVKSFSHEVMYAFIILLCSNCCCWGLEFREP